MTSRDLVRGLTLLVFLTIFIPNGAKSDGPFENERDVFDFIVVGGGTSGSSVAARLVENGKYSVLLIEAGGIPDPAQDIPAIRGRFTSDTKFVNIYKSVQHANAALDNNGTINLVVGKHLGGSSNVNGMVFNRGNPEDYNNWARLSKDDSWRYENMMKYFKKIENYDGNFLTDQHGYDGPIILSSPSYAPASSNWLQAGNEFGLPNGDPNGPQRLSFTPIDFSKNFGRRVSSFTGYIKPLLHSHVKNLFIQINSEASQIIFNGTRAVGVKFTKSVPNSRDVVHFVKARKEIIISCGSIGTPLLLMKSGVGPLSDLQTARIPIVKNLAVGRHLSDHAMFSVPVILNNKSANFDPAIDLTKENWQLYNLNGDGPFSTTMGASGQAFLMSDAAPPSEKRRGWGDIHIIAFSSPPPVEIRPPIVLRNREVFANWTVYVSRPRSRGSVRLNLGNVSGPPVIDFKFLDHPIDMQVAIDGAKWIARICEETHAYRSLGCRVPGPIRACSMFEVKSDEYFKCFVRQRARSGFHPVGSCGMGSKDNPQAVVEPNLKVIGIEGLRIADASVMPAIVNANTQAAVYVIAEKAADMILDEWGGKEDGREGGMFQGMERKLKRIVVAKELLAIG